LRGRTQRQSFSSKHREIAVGGKTDAFAGSEINTLALQSQAVFIVTVATPLLNVH
jgi:hypothetical protein